MHSWNDVVKRGNFPNQVMTVCSTVVTANCYSNTLVGALTHPGGDPRRYEELCDLDVKNDKRRIFIRFGLVMKL